MAVTTTYRTSYGSRVTSSVKNIMLGVVLFFSATGLLWWNEGRAVKTTAMLKEAEGVTVEMVNPKQMDAKLNGKMVHAIAYTSTQDTLADHTYGFSAQVLKLRRDVQYYQWEETRHEKEEKDSDGGTTTHVYYEYDRKWVSRPINSDNFNEPAGHRNIAPFTEGNYECTAPTIDFGAYQLSEELKKQLKNYSPAAPQPSEEQYRLLVDRATQAFSRYRGSSERLVTYQGNMVYVGGSDPSSPSIGDVRITFRQVSPGDFSLLAVVKDTSFKEYVAKNEYSFNRIEPGKISSEQMYKNEHHDNAILTWVLRFIGLLLSIFGINLMFGVVYTVLSIIPFVGKAAEVGIGIVATVLGTCWSLIIIGTAWVFYRPLLGLGMFAVVVLVIILASTVGVKKTKGTPEGELPADEGGQVPPPVPAAPAAPQQFASPAYQPQQPVAPPTFNAPPPPPPIPQGDAAPAPQPPYQTPPPIPQD